MYGSATVESTLSPKGMQLWFGKSIQKDVMDQIISGSWVKPEPQQSYLSMWETFASNNSGKE
jgi:hypothetical protein